MANTTNHFDGEGEHVSRILEQFEIDEVNMKDLNRANRHYRKCVAGACPPSYDRRTKSTQKVIIRRRKPKNFTSRMFRDKKLSEIWIDNGRIHRIKFLEDELKELNTKIEVAMGKTHITEHESNFSAITSNISELESLDVQTKKAKLEILHLKSQIERVLVRRDELSKETESEDQFSNHFRKANRNLEIFEGRVQNARQRECLLNTENAKLRELIKDMLFDRAVFNHYWNKIVKNLKDRRKFLLDMIERSNQAFNQGADFLDNLKKLQSRRAMDRDFHVSEMMNMERQIEANQILNMFLGGKGKNRKLAPLEAREVRRREIVKSDYSSRVNLYNEIIENIVNFTGMPDIKSAVDYYMREENDGFQFFTYLNHLNHQIECLTNNYMKLSTENSASSDYNSRKMKFFAQQIDELHKKLHDEIEKTLKRRDDRDKYEGEIRRYLDAVMEILKILNCDLKPVEKLLGDHRRVSVFNFGTFLSMLETRTNEVLAFVYCDQRKSRDLSVDDQRLAVKSLKRTTEEIVHIEDIITTQQCAECAEGEDVNRYDDKIVYPLDHATIKEIMQRKVAMPEMAFRLHNLSKCNLPRSGIIAGRRYAE